MAERCPCGCDWTRQQSQGCRYRYCDCRWSGRSRHQSPMRCCLCRWCCDRALDNRWPYCRCRGVAKERFPTVGRVVEADCVAKERTKTVGFVPESSITTVHGISFLPMRRDGLFPPHEALIELLTVTVSPCNLRLYLRTIQQPLPRSRDEFAPRMGSALPSRSRGSGLPGDTYETNSCVPKSNMQILALRRLRFILHPSAFRLSTRQSHATGHTGADDEVAGPDRTAHSNLIAALYH